MYDVSVGFADAASLVAGGLSAEERHLYSLAGFLFSSI